MGYDPTGGLHRTSDDDPIVRCEPDQRAIFQRRIRCYTDQGIDRETAVTAVVGPIGSQARAWFEGWL